MAVCDLSGKFFSNLQTQLKMFEEEEGFSGKVKINELTSSETEMLKTFKEELNSAISASIADALVNVFHQKFSSHLYSLAKDKVNGFIQQHGSSGLKTEGTSEKLRAGQNNRYIVNMPVNQSSKLGRDASKYSRSHAEKIKNPNTRGTILDATVLSEATGTKVVILTEDKCGRLNKMQEVNPSTQPSTQTVTLIYRPKSSQYPRGHYDVLINNKTVEIDSNRKDCLFHALARGMKPKASEDEVALEVDRLRVMESETLLRQPGQWEILIKCKEKTERIRGGDWYFAEGGAPKLPKHQKENLKQTVGKTGKYKTMKCQNGKKLFGHFINADHQPPVSSMVKTENWSQKSRLAKAMLEVATNSTPMNKNPIPDVKKKLPTVNVPTEIHNEFPSTKSKAYRVLMAETLCQDDVVGMFKLRILSLMPRFKLVPIKGFKDFDSYSGSEFKLCLFEKSFQKHSKKMVEHWFSLLQSEGVMTTRDCATIKAWINKKGYKNQDDDYKKVFKHL